MDSYFKLLIIIQLLNSVCINYSSLGQWELFQLRLFNHHFVSCVCVCVLVITFWHYKIFQAHLYASWPSLRTNCLLRELRIFLLENGVRNEGLVDRCSHCCQGMDACRLSQLTEKENICEYIYIFINIFLCNQIYLWTKVY